LKNYKNLADLICQSCPEGKICNLRGPETYLNPKVTSAGHDIVAYCRRMKWSVTVGGVVIKSKKKVYC